jgi:lambda repressor-like predicted transcriptional regulator
VSDADADISEQQAVMRDLIRSMMDKTGLDATGLARAAALAPSTLSRFLNQPVKQHLLTMRTLAKLARISGVPVPGGDPLATPREREVIEGFRSTDDQGREMILRFVRSLRSEAPAQREAAE